MTWITENSALATFSQDARLFTSDGSPVGMEFEVEPGATPKGVDNSIGLDGKFVIAYSNYFTPPPGDSTFWAQRHDVDGDLLETRIPVNSPGGYANQLQVSAGAKGSFVVAWWDFSASRIYVRGFGRNPPEVVSTSPEANRSDASASLGVRATFDPEIDPMTVTAGTFSVHRGFSGRLAAERTSLVVSEGTAWNRPPAPFFPGELVEATLTSENMDLTFHPAAPFVWRFRTEVLQGSGQFVAKGLSLPSGPSRAAALADFDLDGDLDAVVAVDQAPGKLYLNDGAGSLSDSGRTLPNEGAMKSLATADVDGDGDIDVLVGSGLDPGTSTGVDLFTNDGLGNFSRRSFSPRQGNDLALGDLDGDGDLDLFLIAEPGVDDEIWLNDGEGIFTFGSNLGGAGDTGTVELGDVDLDGDLDAVVGADLRMEVWSNDGSGHFMFSESKPIGFLPSDIELGDFNGDRRLDAYLSSGLPSQPDVVLVSAPNGSFLVTPQSLGASGSESASLGDVDGDRDLDVVAARSDGTNRIWVNKLARFVDSGQSGDPGVSLDVALGDLDGDGDLDMFVVHSGAADTVWLNQPLDLSDCELVGPSGNNKKTCACILDTNGNLKPDPDEPRIYPRWIDKAAGQGELVVPEQEINEETGAPAANQFTALLSRASFKEFQNLRYGWDFRFVSEPGASDFFRLAAEYQISGDVLTGISFPDTDSDTIADSIDYTFDSSPPLRTRFEGYDFDHDSRTDFIALPRYKFEFRRGTLDPSREILFCPATVPPNPRDRGAAGNAVMLAFDLDGDGQADPDLPHSIPILPRLITFVPGLSMEALIASILLITAFALGLKRGGRPARARIFFLLLLVVPLVFGSGCSTKKDSGSEGSPTPGPGTPSPTPVSLDCSALYVSSFGDTRFAGLSQVDLSSHTLTRIGTASSAIPDVFEIEFDDSTQTLWGGARGSDGSSKLAKINPRTGKVLASFDLGSSDYAGMEFVDSKLYATRQSQPGAASFLVVVDTSTGGAMTVLGTTGRTVPIDGLAYDKLQGILYGLASGPDRSDLVTLALDTGLASTVAPIEDGFGETLTSLDGLEFGSDGMLYAGMSGAADLYPRRLMQIDTGTGVATEVLDTGLDITGLTACLDLGTPTPTPTSVVRSGQPTPTPTHTVIVRSKQRLGLPADRVQFYRWQLRKLEQLAQKAPGLGTSIQASRKGFESEFDRIAAGDFQDPGLRTGELITRMRQFRESLLEDLCSGSASAQPTPAPGSAEARTRSAWLAKECSRLR